MRKLSKRSLAAVQFAHWCVINNVRPYDAAQLIALANRAHAAWARACSYPGYERSETLARDAVRRLAASMGLAASFPGGGWPELTRDGVTLPTLPSLD